MSSERKAGRQPPTSGRVAAGLKHTAATLCRR
jgi:hypothetical protein